MAWRASVGMRLLCLWFGRTESRWGWPESFWTAGFGTEREARFGRVASVFVCGIYHLNKITVNTAVVGELRMKGGSHHRTLPDQHRIARAARQYRNFGTGLDDA